MSKHPAGKTEVKHRQDLARKARKMIASSMDIMDEDEFSLITYYCDFHVLFTFSEIHPLIMISLVRKVGAVGSDAVNICNKMNLTSIHGAHAINQDSAYYVSRSSHWLDAELQKERFFEILNRCVDEASRCYQLLSK